MALLKTFRFVLFLSMALIVTHTVTLNSAEAKVYSDTTIGYSIDVPDGFHYVKKDDPKSSTVFSIFRHAPGTVALNPNLNLTTEDIPKTANLSGTKAYMDVAVKKVKEGLKDVKVAIEPTPVTINGKEFYKFLYSFDYQGTPLLLVQYAHYDSAKKRVYIFSIGDSVKNELKDMASLEQLIKKAKVGN